jgi:G3E family GTPase
MVTVVDGLNFLSDWDEADELVKRGQALGPDDPRTVTDLLVEQVEFADVLVISKVDLASPARVAKVEAAIRGLNPRAKILRARQGQVPLAELLETGRFDMEAARAAPGWMATLRGEETPETAEYGIASFVYRARRPFHPGRFWARLNALDHWRGVLRSKGFFWLATRLDLVGMWSQAGGAAHCEAAGMWFAAHLEAGTDAASVADPETLAEVERQWVDPWGDRRQELVYIGQAMDEAAIRAGLDGCLLTDDELAAGPEAWAAFEDPFPVWGVRGEDDEAEDDGEEEIDGDEDDAGGGEGDA